MFVYLVNKLTVQEYRKPVHVHISASLDQACSRRFIPYDRDLVNERNRYEIEVSIGINNVCN